MSDPAPNRPQTPYTGVIIAGLDRPELVREVLGESPAIPNGHSVPIYLVDPDASRGRALIDSGLIGPSSTRLHLFTGHHCLSDLSGFLSSRLDRHLPRKIIASGSHSANLARQIAPVLEGLVREQEKQIRSSREALERRWAARGPAYWGERYAEIRAGSPARILAITTRYTTFVQHACGDLVDAFTRQGHEARLLREPDSHATITPLLCTRAIESFDPDLIVVANYPRVLHGELFPEGVPHVCWVQDAMAHLFQPLPEPPASLDFIAGHLYASAAALSGYPEEGRLVFPVPVSSAKFHAAPVEPELATTYACDIAYVSHQSEPAEAFHARFIGRFPAEKREGIQQTYEQARRLINRWAVMGQAHALRMLRRRLAESFGKGEDRSLQDTLSSQYLQPLAERLLRHQMLDWAAQIARDHDLTLRLYGNGWEHHPSLAPYACGPLPHDEHLRACYQSAKVHLHASTSGSSHQRVFECAMAGGLALSRRCWDEFNRHDWCRMSLFLAEAPPPDACLLKWRHPAYAIRNHPELRSILADRERAPYQAAGWYHRLFDGVYNRIATDDFFKYWDTPVPPGQMRAMDILGDPFETTFSTRSELEEKILLAINDPRWRREQSGGIARRARQRVSMDRFARMLLDTVTDRLAPLSQPTLQEAHA